MPETVLTVNGKKYKIDVAPDTPLLWVLRDQLGLTGTKYGCGEGLCGACTVHINGEAVRSCTVPVSEAVGKRITTIEGLPAAIAHPLQKAWLEEEVSQCGYCQPGILMTTAALLAKKPKPSDSDVDAALDDHLCRCGTYGGVRRAIRRVTNGGGAK